MAYKGFTILFFILIALGCTLDDQKEKENLSPEGSFVHIVYLNLKDDLSDDEFDILVTELKRLGEIENVQNFTVGSFEDLGDKRALGEFEMIMEMTFTGRSEYDLYQENPLHDEVKKATGRFLASPPATYDYIKR